MRLHLAEPSIPPVEVFPGKKPVNGRPHVLEVGTGESFIEHTHECLDRFGDPACDVSYVQDWGDETELTEGLVPGEYWIVFHVEGRGEDAGFWLELMYPEETP